MWECALGESLPQSLINTPPKRHKNSIQSLLQNEVFEEVDTSHSAMNSDICLSDAEAAALWRLITLQALAFCPISYCLLCLVLWLHFPEAPFSSVHLFPMEGLRNSRKRLVASRTWYPASAVDHWNETHIWGYLIIAHTPSKTKELHYYNWDKQLRQTALCSFGGTFNFMNLPFNELTGYTAVAWRYNWFPYDSVPYMDVAHNISNFTYVFFFFSV